MAVGPPDFVGVGVQKAGTSWWYEALAQHPDVHDAPDLHKERHFFDRYWKQSFDDSSIKAYHTWFPRPPGLIVGEWTPDYVYYPWVAPLLKRAAPNAKVLCLLRDPVSRYSSGVLHDRRRGRSEEPRRAAEAFERGMYVAQLDRLRRSFSEESVLILQYERCVLDPEDSYRRTCRFLGIDDRFIPDNLQEPVNVTLGLSLQDVLLDGLAVNYWKDVIELADQGLIDLDLWPEFSRSGSDPG